MWSLIKPIVCYGSTTTAKGGGWVPGHVDMEMVMVEGVLGVEDGVPRLQRPDPGDFVGDGTAPGVGLPEERL